MFVLGAVLKHSRTCPPQTFLPNSCNRSMTPPPRPMYQPHRCGTMTIRDTEHGTAPPTTQCTPSPQYHDVAQSDDLTQQPPPQLLPSLYDPEQNPQENNLDMGCQNPTRPPSLLIRAPLLRGVASLSDVIRIPCFRQEGAQFLEEFSSPTPGPLQDKPWKVLCR